ncbi:hypothetical protein IMG5_008280, partial [Ichthyophthirius multifiliis]
MEFLVINVKQDIFIMTLNVLFHAQKENMKINCQEIAKIVIVNVQLVLMRLIVILVLRIGLRLIVNALLIILIARITHKLVLNALLYLLDALFVMPLRAKHVYRLIFQKEIYVQMFVLLVNGEIRQIDNVQLAQLNVQLVLMRLIVILVLRIGFRLIVNALLKILIARITHKLVLNALLYLLDALFVILKRAKHVYRLIFQKEIYVQMFVLLVNGGIRQIDNVQLAQLNVQLVLMRLIVILVLRIGFRLIVNALLIILIARITHKLVLNALLYLSDALFVILKRAKHVYRLIFQKEIYVQMFVLLVNGEIRQIDNVQLAQLNVQLVLMRLIVIL